MATFGTGQQAILPNEEFGNKAAGLSEMAASGIPVPPGFSLGVVVCREYFDNGEVLPGDVPDLLRQGIAYLEQATAKGFGNERRPLLVSVRSGAPISMPGIMDTILNVGLTPHTVHGLIYQTGNPQFAWDTYRRFLENFGESVFGHDPKKYRVLLNAVIGKEGISDERELDYQSLRTLCQQYERQFFSDSDEIYLRDVLRQLERCTIAVIRSWMSPRAESFRRMNLVEGDTGTAVTVQAMVFGNMGASSGAGVAFTRNPWTGVRELLVDFRFGAQGEDVVSGDRSAATQLELADALPEIHQDLLTIGSQLETRFRDMQDLEFTIQEGRLYILQSRSGKRAPLAALRVAVDLCREGVISHHEARTRLKGIDLGSIEIQRVNSDEPPVAWGVPASGGVAQGSIVFSSERAEAESARGPVILVRETASPDDIEGIGISEGILTARGARTSHAAVVARQMGKVCVVNCTELAIDTQKHRCTIGPASLREGEIISLDGNSGAVYRGRVKVIREKPDSLIEAVRTWELFPY
jgi:pyruvate,orthophosphate dikinase